MSFSQEFKEALEFISPRSLQGSVSTALKRSRKVFNKDVSKFIKKESKLKRTLSAIRRRFDWRPKPKRIETAVIDFNDIENTQFSFLAFPGRTSKWKLLDPKKRRKGNKNRATKLRRKNDPRRVLTQVNVGKGFKKLDGVFIARGNGDVDQGGNLLPFRRDKGSKRDKYKSQKQNVFNATLRNEQKLTRSTETYNKNVMRLIAESVLKKAAKKLAKTVPLDVSA